MDVASIAASLVTAQAGALQQAIATRVLKMNLDAQKSVLQLLQPAQNVPAPRSDAGPGLGDQLDISV